MTETARRLVFVSQAFPPEKGGNASRIHDNATSLTDENWDVTVLSPPPCYPPGEFDRSWQRQSTDQVNGVTVHRLWTWQPTRQDPSFVSRLVYYLVFAVHALVWMLLNARRVDVVVTSTPPISTGAPGLVMSALGKPWLVDVRDLWIDASISLGYLEEGSRIERVSRQFQRTVLYRADRISVTTPSMRRLVCERYGEALEEKTVVLPNGVNTDEFAPRDESGSGQRSVSDAAESQPTIIYTGNLGHAQDLESLVRAMAHLSSDDAVLKLVGSGDAESELKRLTAELGLDDRVEFVGLVERERIARLIIDAAVGAAPLKNSDELSYAMPTKVYEYLACGVPALVAGRGEIERFAERSGAAIHVENDPERIAEQLDELLADEMRREALGDDGRRYIESNYDRREIASMFDDQLTQIHSGVVCSPLEATREEVQA